MTTSNRARKTTHSESGDAFDANESAEAEFHDDWAEQTDVGLIDVDTLFRPASGPENVQILKWMGDLKGKRVLEVGCGLGEASVYFAKQGAIVTAVDISAGMLEATRKLAKRYGVLVRTIQISANDMSAIQDGAYDYVYAANLLHHVNIASFLDHLQRKLRPGGSAFFWDPVLYNPVIQVYRRMAAAVRTPDEHPLTRSDLAYIRTRFAKVETRFFWYSALVIFIMYFLVNRLHPGESRYWKRIHEDASRVGWWLTWLHKVDRVLFAWIPGIKWLSWNMVIRAETKR
jgi:2-polyprenyl-3-methyl-5-hydroxy-6-metoxy-1,4-benzoquinol methylase